MYTVSNQLCKIVSVTNVSEKHGKDRVPALSIGLYLVGSGSMLDQFDSALRPMLYRKPQPTPGGLPLEYDDNELTELRFPFMRNLAWDRKYAGYMLRFRIGASGNGDVVRENLRLVRAPTSEVQTDGDSIGGCIKWPGNKNRDGYGTVKRNGQMFLAHRLVYCDHNGISIESIQDFVVRHACDNPVCINPAHLLIGTHADNTQDKLERGRQPKGEKNGQSKLTVSQVAEIRSIYVHGSREFGAPALARKFGVGETAINNIIHNRKWVVNAASAGDQGVGS